MNVESEHWIEALFSKAQYIDTLSRVNQGPRPVFSDDCIAIQCLLWNVPTSMSSFEFLAGFKRDILFWRSTV